MTARMLPGGPVADAVFADLQPRIEKLREAGHPPGLATILVGDDEPSERYVAMKQAKAAELGFNPGHHEHLPATATQDDLHAVIRGFNEADDVDGILLQYPIPGHLDYERAHLRDRPRQGRRRRAPDQHGPPRARHAGTQAVHACGHRGDPHVLRDPGRGSLRVHRRARLHDRPAACRSCCRRNDRPPTPP